ncbi:1-acyl-sn-glycerol-3-phosphate acyltransferase [Blattabacterium punctulatus]|uniref:1-acyl-sn-glycerol-3-phosphate acyltransferase n=1 Tax=Blattabacterium punctulatus TaxID=164514 RepID=A0ABM6WN92_9FLAO|nr:lysophospholipid acyltransferase family protein [Blattabacterium punctulatus]AWU40069.1 1-acyl-sn-glycerol-3-phosphate acyltransferase [Blattabacterium punctulatus]AWU40611.1 1-acyl-sn-glycerol-3-phosphate acyltransferase [Blattabacterium punctulatus]
MKKKEGTLFRDAFGNFHFVKRFLIFTFGCISYNRYNGFNQLKLKGTEYIKDLPDKRVLFVSNHQTYFADVFAMFHVFCSVKNGFINTIKNPIYLLNPKINLYYLAAKETINKGIFTKLFTYSGAITVKRTWREGKKKIKKSVDLSEITRMGIALNDGWLITFPQGTTKEFAPGRRGIVHVIRKFNPIVVPIVIDGFQKAYDKKGIRIKKKGVLQKMIFKKPIKLDLNNDTTNIIMEKIMDSIEQSPKYYKKTKN